MQPKDIFKDQPIIVPAAMVNAIWSYIGSKPAAETAWLVVQFQQIVGPQMKQIEDVEKAKSDDKAEVVDVVTTESQTA